MPVGTKPPLQPNQARIAISGTFSGSEWTNVFHFGWQASSGPTQADADTVCQDILNAYQTDLMPLHSTASECLFARQVMILAGPSELISEKTSTTAGSASGTALPANCALVLSWNINAYYRGGKPRTYIPAQSNNNTASVIAFTGAWTANATTKANAFITAVNAITTSDITNVTLGSVAFARHNAWLVTPVLYPFKSAVVHTRIDSQRRRLGKETT